MKKEEIDSAAKDLWPLQTDFDNNMREAFKRGVLSETASKHWEPKWINEDCPKDGTHIMRMHKIYKCLISVYYNEKHSEQLKICPWIESTKSNSWPDEAFESGYIILPTFND